MNYLDAISHVRRLKNFYSLKQIAEYMGVAPSMLRNIVNEAKLKKGDAIYIQRMPEHHKAKFIECVQILTRVLPGGSNPGGE